ncbi:MAG: DUF2141 domain-containing protein [Cyclobacteriaceae bacterium]|nr:DUF2141 domain-containing protein [Cyclobacteriaceae bacterium]
MKELILILLINGVSQAILAQSKVEVVVDGIRDTVGTIHVALFKEPGTFLKKPLAGKSVKAKKGAAIVVFEGVNPGTYAISIIHDANRNGKLDANLFGIPKEGFGFSNNAMGKFGPPSFEKASIKIPATSTLRITLKYL